jgi:23S rRNA pseudouridine1911/1915/1917 synthase
MDGRKKKIVLTYKVDSYRSGWAIVEYLAHRFPYHSAEGWARRVEDGRVSLNGRTVESACPVRQDDTVQYTILHAEPEVDDRCQVVYEDDDLLAVSKSGNIPVHACGIYITHTLIAVLKARFGEAVNLAHRLDRETSGLVLLSKNKLAARLLGRMFQRGKVTKKYLAVVHGRVPEEVFEINAPIGMVPYERRESLLSEEDGPERKLASFLPKRQVDFAGGKPAVTRFERLAVLDEYTVLRAFPITGRTNQIRVHLAHRGFPVVGDKVYSLAAELKEECVRCGRTEHVRRALVMDRQALHCSRMEFVHPSTGLPMRLAAPVPEDMRWAVGSG